MRSAARPSRLEISAGRTFTALMFAAAARLAPAEARQLLSEFEQQGVVARTVGGWTLTPWGQRVALDLAQCDGRAEEE